MQVKKFEAPTIQEALEVIKRELGPEAIILQTKQYKRGFGLMSKASVEVTAAVSERALQKKSFTEKRLPEPQRKSVQKMPADRQAELYDKYMDRHLEQAMGGAQDRVDMSRRTAAPARGQTQAQAQTQAKARGAKPAAPSQGGITPTRYIDIEDEDHAAARRAPAQRAQARPSPTQPAQSHQIHQAQGLQSPSPMPAQKANLGMTVEEEMGHLKRMIEELKTTQELPAGAMGGGSLTPALQDAFEQLVLNGIDKRYALSLAKKVGFELGAERAQSPDDVLDQLAAEIMSSTEVLSPLSGIEPGARASGQGPAVIALVGPTGVGKTTTVAKIASEALLKRNLKVGLINLDSYKIAAFDQLATYAKILNVPFRSAQSAEDLRAAIQDFRSLDVVLVDTTGRSQRDPKSLKEMEQLLQSVPGLRSQLVLSATTRDAELYDMANRFLSFRPQGIIFSKLDEATIYGAVYNVSQKSKLPLLYFTTGQRVPEDIEEATGERVAALIMDL